MNTLNKSDPETDIIIAQARQTVLDIKESVAQSVEYNQKAWEFLQFAKDHLRTIKKREWLYDDLNFLGSEEPV